MFIVLELFNFVYKKHVHKNSSYINLKTKPKSQLLKYYKYFKILEYLWTAHAFTVPSRLNDALFALNYIGLDGYVQNIHQSYIIIYSIVRIKGHTP